MLHSLKFQISYSFPAGSWETEAVRRGKNKSSEWRKKETWKVRLPFWLFLVLGCCHCCWRGKNVRDHNVRCFCPRVLVGDICRVVRLFNCRWYFLEKGLQGPPFYFFRLMGLIDTVPVEWRKLVPSFSLFFFLLFVYLSVHLFIYLFISGVMYKSWFNLQENVLCSSYFFCKVVTFKSQAVKFNVML